MPSGSPEDTDLVRVLERAFAHHAGSDARIDAVELKRALGLRSEFLASRVLAAFDADKSGSVDKDEFLAGVRQLVLGSDRDKLAFAFRVHDHDGDGFIDADELLRMIALSLAESDVAERVTQPPAQLVASVMAAVDTNRDGRISFEELERAVRRHPALLARMTRSEAIWIAPNEELLLLLDAERGRPAERIGAGVWSRAEKAWPIAVWAVANVAVFAWSMTFGRASDTRDPAMQLGRAIGACLDLNGGVVLVPVMRRMIGWLRARWIGRVVPVDHAVDFHKIVGHTLFALAVAHAVAFFVAYAGGHAATGTLHLFETERGLTGTLLLAVFAVMWIFSWGLVRRSRHFELFYFTHLLYLVWLLLLFLHAPRILVFSGVAIVAFLVEQLVRLRRRRPEARVTSILPLRSGVTRLELERPKGFTFGAGDYVFLRIPQIAKREWHPFTISSAPESPNLTVHVRSLGNWTAALRRFAEDHRREPITAFVDGPYGSPSARIFASKHAVLIGAGIGVTPFASVLGSIVHRANERGAAPMALERAHFFWLNRDPYSFEWFRGIISRLEEEDTSGLLDVHLLMTGARAGATAFGLELAREIQHARGRSDIVTGLRTHTHFGDPDWEQLLGRIAQLHQPAKIDVFFCGPHGLARRLAPLCKRLGMAFHEEQF